MRSGRLPAHRERQRRRSAAALRGRRPDGARGQARRLCRGALGGRRGRRPRRARATASSVPPTGRSCTSPARRWRAISPAGWRRAVSRSRRAVLYRARRAPRLAEAAADALREGRADGVLLYSRRSAAAFAQALRAGGLAPLGGRASSASACPPRSPSRFAAVASRPGADRRPAGPDQPLCAGGAQQQAGARRGLTRCGLASAGFPRFRWNRTADACLTGLLLQPLRSELWRQTNQAHPGDRPAARASAGRSSSISPAEEVGRKPAEGESAAADAAMRRRRLRRAGKRRRGRRAVRAGSGSDSDAPPAGDQPIPSAFATGEDDRGNAEPASAPPGRELSLAF